MNTLTKIFNFTIDTEGWVPNPDTGVDMAWYRRRQSQATGSDPLATFGGSLRSTAKYGHSGLKYSDWTWNGKYTDLGVPRDAVVKRIQLSYLYRWQGRNSNKRAMSFVDFAEGDVQSGPAVLCTGTGTQIGVFSSAIDCIERFTDDGAGTRNVGQWWDSYPVSPDYPYGGGTQQLTDYPIQDKPPSWGEAVGDYITVNHSSIQSIQFVINNVLPNTTIGSGDSRNYWFRYKFDRVEVNIDYVANASKMLSIF